MLAWSAPYLPPALTGINHPNLALFDSYSKNKFEIGDQKISMYVCGITPYDATHLGHAATYIVFDLINRYLIGSGREVSFIENVTDIDDPLFERAKRDGANWQELSKSQIELFQADMTELRVIPPKKLLGVVESMQTVIDSISKLVQSGKTYAIDDDLYLDLSKDPKALANLPISLEEAVKIFAQRGGDPARAGKRNSLDPLLWVKSKEDEPSWRAPFGSGRPGWHIECVAIALNNLPEVSNTSITIQGGGSDLIFPHHYMTGVQARSLTDKEFASVYVHSGMIGLNGEKMSKSLGNLVFVSKLISAGHDPMAIRLALLDRSYRADLMWSDEILSAANAFLAKIGIALAKTEVAPTRPVVQEIVDALADNLDTQRALSAVKKWALDTESGLTGGESGEISRALDLYLGVTL